MNIETVIAWHSNKYKLKRRLKMKIIVIGSSNVHRFEKLLKDEDKQKIDVRKCTRFESFKVGMDELEETDKKVLICGWNQAKLKPGSEWATLRVCQC